MYIAKIEDKETDSFRHIVADNLGQLLYALSYLGSQNKLLQVDLVDNASTAKDFIAEKRTPKDDLVFGQEGDFQGNY